MYVNFEAVMLMVMGLLVGFVVGITTRSKVGLVVFTLGGLAIACIGITGLQSTEIEGWRYRQLERIRGEDCRIAPMIASALTDRKISVLEYRRIMDVAERNEVVDARDSLAQVSRRQCVTS